MQDKPRLLLPAGLIALIMAAFAFPYLPPVAPAPAVAAGDHDHGAEGDKHKGHDEAVHGDGDDHDDHGGHEEGGHDGHAGHDGHEEGAVKLSPAEMKEFGIKVATAGPGTLGVYITLPGEILLNPDRVAHIVPRVPGVVRKVYKTIGDAVKKGEVMALLESAELGQAKIEYLSKKQQLDLAVMDKNRTKIIHDNTDRLLAILKNSPDLDIIQRQTEGLDMGENRSRLTSAYTNFRLTRAAYDREKNLFDKKISSQADFLEAERDFKSAQAEYFATYNEISFAIKRRLLDKQRDLLVAEMALKAAERHLHILGLTKKEIAALERKSDHGSELSLLKIKSPFSGVVIEKHIALGEMLEGSAKTFEIADLGTVWVNLNVYQKDLASVKKGQEVIVSAGHGIPEVTGKISYIGPVVGEQTRTALARVVLPNKNGLLRPGLFIKAKVAVENKKMPLLVRSSAIQRIDNRQVVFVLDEDGFEPKPVVVGRSDARFSEIVSGLSAGDRYAAQGAFTLKSQLAKGSFESGHSH